MNVLRIDLEHCYGIKRLKAELDFTECNACAIYAPNGAMKSSFAQTFKDIATAQVSRDRVFPSRITRRVVTDELGIALSPEVVLVLPPYDEVFGDSTQTATLLVNAALRKEYEQLYGDVESSKQQFLKALKQQSRSRRDLEIEVSRAFTRTPNEFYRALSQVQEEVAALSPPRLADVPFDLVADEKVASFLASQDVKAILQSYINTYNELLGKSQYFKRGTFDYYNAATIGRTLTTNGFFEANHAVTLNGDKRQEIKSQKELEELIAKEKAVILRDEKLRTAFDEMEKRITKNEMLRDFQEFLSDNEEVLVLMGDLDKLKREILKAYFKAHEGLYKELIGKYRDAEKRGREIEIEAERERTQWENVIELFNRRFFVPFKLTVKNKVGVMLGDEPLPSLGFTFQEGAEAAELEHPQLLEILSTGERKALYILNVLFEVEARRQARQETVFVVDDIADSFDYKNKYAIIQYLRDIAEEERFKLILLTHNFDFFRTVNSRFVRYSHCFMVQRTAAGTELVPATGIRNIFVNDWKPRFYENGRKRIASIPFIRNIVEYTRGVENTAYGLLTDLLHWRPESEAITHRQLDEAYGSVFADAGSWPDPDMPVLETMRVEAEACKAAPEVASLENKIVLAMAIRLLAEKHMSTAIAEAAGLSAIGANRTAKLLQKFKGLRDVKPESIQILDKVALMTPENIHLNSFMYEPILDMSDDHLRQLHNEVAALV